MRLGGRLVASRNLLCQPRCPPVRHNVARLHDGIASDLGRPPYCPASRASDALKFLLFLCENGPRFWSPVGSNYATLSISPLVQSLSWTGHCGACRRCCVCRRDGRPVDRSPDAERG